MPVSKSTDADQHGWSKTRLCKTTFARTQVQLTQSRTSNHTVFTYAITYLIKCSLFGQLNILFTSTLWAQLSNREPLLCRALLPRDWLLQIHWAWGVTPFRGKWQRSVSGLLGQIKSFIWQLWRCFKFALLGCHTYKCPCVFISTVCSSWSDSKRDELFWAAACL